MKRFFQNYSLSIVLAALFLVSWIAHAVFGWFEFAAEQRALGEVPRWLGDSGYVWTYGATTFENWQSEFLQLLTFVTLSAFLHHKGSPEAKDSDEKTDSQLLTIQERLKQLELQLARDAR